MIEPTESETRETLDAFIQALRDIDREVTDDPELVRNAPHTTPETGAPPNSLKRYGVAFPTVRAPTTVPMATPRPERNHVAIIFMAGG